MVQLDGDLLALAQPAGVAELLGRRLDGDDLRPLLRHRHRDRPAAAAELEHPLALEPAEQAQVGLGRDVGAVGDDVERAGRPRPATR